MANQATRCSEPTFLHLWTKVHQVTS